MSDLKLGNVWGRIQEVTTKKSNKGKGKPYLFVTVDCGNERLGQVRTFGRIWGDKRIADFLPFRQANAAETIRLTGFFSQYDDEEGQRNSNYTFTKFQLAKGKEHKAAFVLKGKVSEKWLDGNIQALKLLVVNEATEEYPEKEEAFTVYIHPQTLFEGYDSFAGYEEIAAGHQVEVSGYLRTREPEDEYGMPSGDIRPYAMRIKNLSAGTAAKSESVPY